MNLSRGLMRDLKTAVVVRRVQDATLEKQDEHLQAHLVCTIRFHSVCINGRPKLALTMSDLSSSMAKERTWRARGH